jgi:hypothetical protein
MKNIKLLLLLTALVFGGSVFAQVTLTNAKNVNGDELDFSPVPYKDGVIYTTSKSTRFLTCPSDNPERFTDLKFAKRNADGTFGDVDKLRGDVNGRYNDGVATFNDAATIMIFSRNNKEGKNEADSINLKLYTAELEGDKW